MVRFRSLSQPSLRSSPHRDRRGPVNEQGVANGYLTDKMFHFTCFNVEDPDDFAVGLVNGEVTIPGNLLRREVFDPVVNQVCLVALLIASHRAPIAPVPAPSSQNTRLTAWNCFSSEQVLDLIEAQTKKVDQRLDALLLVGGFSGSEYLFRRVRVRVPFHQIPRGPSPPRRSHLKCPIFDPFRKCSAPGLG